MSVNIVMQPSGGVSYTDDGNTVYLEKRERGRTGGTPETTDTWGGATSAINELYTQLAVNRRIESIKINQTGASSKMTVIWATDNIDGTSPEPPEDPEQETAQWDVSAIEIPTALAAHPYFQVGYSPGAGEVIETGLAEADLAISNGEKFIADGPYKDWTSRYYALRMAGVEEWPQLGVQVQSSFDTDDEVFVASLMATAFQVVPVAAIGMPAGIINQVAALQKITSYQDPLPSSYILEANLLEWLHRVPEISLKSIIGEPPVYSVKDTYWGIWKWSSVLYPGGSWDPQGEMTA